MTGTYGGGSITVPMNGAAMGTPLGLASPPTTRPRFGAFVLVTTGDGGGTGGGGGGSGPRGTGSRTSAMDGESGTGCDCQAAPSSHPAPWSFVLALGGTVAAARRIRRSR